LWVITNSKRIDKARRVCYTVTVPVIGHISGAEETALKKRLTIRDVAAAAGVSHQTVSRVINERPDVASETRRRVLAVIDELGYRPSDVARSLARRHSFSLGVVTAGLDYVGPSRTLKGITREAEASGYTLLLKELRDFDTRHVEPLLHSLLDKQVDGILWAVPEVGDNRAWLNEQLPDLPVPVVFLTMQPRPDLAVVSVDNFAGGRLATAHLLEQGYKHIAHISGPLDWWEARQRKAAWADTLALAGIEPAEEHCEPGDWSSASGERAVRALYTRYPEMDAVFTGNDQMALGLLQFACRAGLRVPDDLAVVGFDGIVESAHYWPPLTTVSQDQQELGCMGVRKLVQSLEPDPSGRTADRQMTWLQPVLIVRDSSRRAATEPQKVIRLAGTPAKGGEHSQSRPTAS
jgi:DNA-binding LacI/PurR family transcriptional regulator